MIKKRTIFVYLMFTIFFSIFITSCGSENKPTYVWNMSFPDGEYDFTFKGTEGHPDDVLKINLKSKDLVTTVVLNEVTIYGAVRMRGFSGNMMGIEIHNQNTGNLKIYYDLTGLFHLTVSTREKDYDLVSFTINGVNALILRNVKTYELRGTPAGFWITDAGEESAIYSSHTFHPGEKLIIKYKPLENYNYTEKYYITLYDATDTKQIYKRAANNVDTLSYTFTKDDIGRCFEIRLFGIDEYEGSEISKLTLTVTAE